MTEDHASCINPNLLPVLMERVMAKLDEPGAATYEGIDGVIREVIQDLRRGDLPPFVTRPDVEVLDLRIRQIG